MTQKGRLNEGKSKIHVLHFYDDSQYYGLLISTCIFKRPNVPNPMQIKKIVCFHSLALDLALEKFII